jgi:hypothetical protein
MKLLMNQEREKPLRYYINKNLTLDLVLWIRIRIQEGKNNPKTRKKLINFVF